MATQPLMATPVIEGSAEEEEAGEPEEMPSVDPLYLQAGQSPYRDADRAALIKEATRLLRERQRLARLHRQAETKSAYLLAQRKRQGSVLTSFVGEEETGSYESSVDWSLRAETAKETFQETETKTASHDLRCRLLKEETQERLSLAEEQVNYSQAQVKTLLTDMMRRSVAAMQVEEQRLKLQEFHRLADHLTSLEKRLEEVRKMNFKLHVIKTKTEDTGTQSEELPVESQSNLLQMIVENDARNQITADQEASMIKCIKLLENLEEELRKKLNKKEELEENLKSKQDKIKQLQKTLKDYRIKMKHSAEILKSSRRVSSQRPLREKLVLERIFTEDIERKLTLKENLEEEIRNLRSDCMFFVRS